MGWLFKLFGSLMVIAASFAAGYMKSYELRQRGRRLTELCRGLSSLKERMRMGCGEIERLVTESFDSGLIKADGGFSVDGRWLDKKDVSLIHEYLTDIGMTDSDSEYNRTELYIKLLSKTAMRRRKNVRSFAAFIMRRGFSEEYLFAFFSCR